MTEPEITEAKRLVVRGLTSQDAAMVAKAELRVQRWRAVSDAAKTIAMFAFLSTCIYSVCGL